jgi:hypothetical protein
VEAAGVELSAQTVGAKPVNLGKEGL